MRQRFTN